MILFPERAFAKRLAGNGLQIEIDGRKKNLKSQNDEHGRDYNRAGRRANAAAGIENPIVPAIENAGQKHW